ncbi:kinase-like protein [Gigaspora margarita]|uniref:Kinase-like protein n=1 Tax=Gigaspora margarita TaxID=4874 RepID=A0A8H4AL75_GIGMA|nr:kinase-like protein [Gigaspora margarita]
MLLLRTRQKSVKEFGVVHRAYLKDIKQNVALKSLDYDNEHSFDNIAREVKCTTKVNHGKIIQFFGLLKILKQNRIIWFFNTQTVEIFEVIGMIIFPNQIGQLKSEWQKKFLAISSLGVLLWEFSSGVPPFRDSKDLIEITFHVIKGNRETPIEGTPNDFKNLYCAAWSVDP